jgi:hypothetical protein
VAITTALAIEDRVTAQSIDSVVSGAQSFNVSAPHLFSYARRPNRRTAVRRRRPSGFACDAKPEAEPDGTAHRDGELSIYKVVLCSRVNDAQPISVA